MKKRAMSIEEIAEQIYSAIDFQEDSPQTKEALILSIMRILTPCFEGMIGLDIFKEQ